MHTVGVLMDAGGTGEETSGQDYTPMELFELSLYSNSLCWIWQMLVGSCAKIPA